MSILLNLHALQVFILTSHQLDAIISKLRLILSSLIVFAIILLISHVLHHDVLSIALILQAQHPIVLNLCLLCSIVSKSLEFYLIVLICHVLHQIISNLHLLNPNILQLRKLQSILLI